VSGGSPEAESLRTGDPAPLVAAPALRVGIPARYWLRALGVPQALCLFGCFAAIIGIEAVSRPLDLLAGTEGRPRRRDARRKRAAQRVVRALGDL